MSKVTDLLLETLRRAAAGDKPGLGSDLAKLRDGLARHRDHVIALEADVDEHVRHTEAGTTHLDRAIFETGLHGLAATLAVVARQLTGFEFRLELELHGETSVITSAATRPLPDGTAALDTAHLPRVAVVSKDDLH